MDKPEEVAILEMAELLKHRVSEIRILRGISAEDLGDKPTEKLGEQYRVDLGEGLVLALLVPIGVFGFEVLVFDKIEQFEAATEEDLDDGVLLGFSMTIELWEMFATTIIGEYVEDFRTTEPEHATEPFEPMPSSVATNPDTDHRVESVGTAMGAAIVDRFRGKE